MVQITFVSHLPHRVAARIIDFPPNSCNCESLKQIYAIFFPWWVVTPVTKETTAMRILTILFEFDVIAVHAFNFLRDVALCSLCLPDSISVICILILTKATYLIITALYTLYTKVLVLQILIQTKLTEMCGNKAKQSDRRRSDKTS
jgi:hypothetical protein